jgi:hypothetical protein
MLQRAHASDIRPISPWAMHRFCDAQRCSPLCPALRASTTSAALLSSIVPEYSLPIHAYEPGVPEIVVCERPLCEFVGPMQSFVRKVVALDCAMLWLLTVLCCDSGALRITSSSPRGVCSWSRWSADWLRRTIRVVAEEGDDSSCSSCTLGESPRTEVDGRVRVDKTEKSRKV